MIGSLELFQPTTVQEASQALAELGDKARIYAGGAELLLLLRNGLLQSEVLVDVKRIERLHRLEMDNGVLRIGACVTHQALENSALVREHAPADRGHAQDERRQQADDQDRDQQLHQRDGGALRV